MSFQKFKTKSFCVVGRHKSSTKNRVGEITFIEKDGKEVQFLVGNCAICDKRKSMIVSDNGFQVESLSDFFNNLGKKGLNI